MHSCIYLYLPSWHARTRSVWSSPQERVPGGGLSHKTSQTWPYNTSEEQIFWSPKQTLLLPWTALLLYFPEGQIFFLMVLPYQTLNVYASFLDGFPASLHYIQHIWLLHRSCSSVKYWIPSQWAPPGSVLWLFSWEFHDSQRCPCWQIVFLAVSADEASFTWSNFPRCFSFPVPRKAVRTRPRLGPT